MRAVHAAALLLLCLGAVRADMAWRTERHEQGFCATYGICGRRKDGDGLSCAKNIPAPALSEAGLQKLRVVCPQLAGSAGGRACCTEEQLDFMEKQVQLAAIFLVGCPACLHNFKHFFCLITCSPDQATFANVTAVQAAPDNNATAVESMDNYVAASLGAALYDSCKDVVFPVMNVKAMKFVGGSGIWCISDGARMWALWLCRGAANFQEWFDFMGLVKDRRFPPTGSPFQINFPPEEDTPEGMRALNDTIPSCGEPGFACSCGDCPTAPGCEPPPPPPPPPPPGCPAVGSSRLSCADVAILATYLGLLACLPLFIRHAARLQRRSSAEGELPLGEGGEEGRPQRVPKRPSHGSPEIEEQLLGGAGGTAAAPHVQYPWAEQLLRRWFYVLGSAAARRPGRTLAAAGLLVLGCAAGLARFSVLTDPQDLWVGPGSQAAREKRAYEASFGPFYRITQLILSTTPAANSSYTAPSGLPAIVTDAHLRLLFEVQDEVDALAAGPRNASLADVCLKPLGAACATESVLQYWKMSREIFEKGAPPTGVKVSPEFCFGHWSTQCRSAFQAPIDPQLVLGGFPLDPGAFRNYTADATAFVVTYPIDSHPSKREDALAWEAAFVELATGRLSRVAAAAGLRLSLSTERSVQDELARESRADVGTVAASYLVMLLYIAVALGSLPRGRASLRDLAVHSRAGLGLGGVLIVGGAVLGALGLLSWGGGRVSLIVMECLPFLALAVGVDNMFILAQAAEDQPAALPAAERVARALAAVGPSIALAASCEVAAFAAGALTSMPALRAFSACAALAVALLFLLQVTAFPALLALDTQRIEEGRLDCFPCGRASKVVPLYGDEFEELPYGDEQPALAGAGAEEEGVYGAGPPGDGGRVGVTQVLRAYMRSVHAPLLRVPAVKAAVLALFGGLFLFSVAMLPRLERGLDQSVALPRDSYLQQYYSDVLSVLRVGPPLMLVVRDMNLSAQAPDVNRVCAVAGCDRDSLMNQVSQLSRSPWSSYVASPAASWLDDFLSWASPDIPQCCRAAANGTRCPPPDQPPCADDPAACAGCAPCFAAGDLPGGRPTLRQFQEKLPWFMDALPSEACAKGGAGAYSDAVQRDPATGAVAGLDRGVVAASAFRTSYVVLSSQADFIGALRTAREFAARASSSLGLDVYPYSVFHIFFEQYLSIGGEAIALLGSAAAAVFLICLAFTGSPSAACLILLCLALVVTDLMGVMALWGIQLNAVSLVNLVMALGIGVEFFAHLVHAFMAGEGAPQARADAALGSVGAAVLSGITLTKVAGVAVLALARTQIFEIYYFRMYLALVLLGAAHGLLLLPVLLSTLGPEALAFEHGDWAPRPRERRPDPRRRADHLPEPGDAPGLQTPPERA